MHMFFTQRCSCVIPEIVFCDDLNNLESFVVAEQVKSLSVKTVVSQMSTDLSSGCSTSDPVVCSLGKQAGNGPGAWVLATHIGECDGVSGSWISPGPSRCCCCPLKSDSWDGNLLSFSQKV